MLFEKDGPLGIDEVEDDLDEDDYFDEDDLDENNDVD